MRPDLSADHRRLDGAEQDFNVLAREMQTAIDAYAKNDLDKHRRPNIVLFAVGEAKLSAHPLAGCRDVDVHLLPAMRRKLEAA